MATVRNRASYAEPVDQGIDANTFTITPSDTAYLPVPVDAIKVGATGGTITCITNDGESVVFNVAANDTQFTNQIVRVMATGTTATTLIGIASKALR